VLVVHRKIRIVTSLRPQSVVLDEDVMEWQQQLRETTIVPPTCPCICRPYEKQIYSVESSEFARSPELRCCGGSGGDSTALYGPIDHAPLSCSITAATLIEGQLIHSNVHSSVLPQLGLNSKQSTSPAVTDLIQAVKPGLHNRVNSHAWFVPKHLRIYLIQCS
jgi:hypothetical protein